MATSINSTYDTLNNEDPYGLDQPALGRSDYGSTGVTSNGVEATLNASTTSRGRRSRTQVSKPRILLMGLRRSGKSSIQKVVFHKMSPHETLFLESTQKIVKSDVSTNSLVQFQVWDFPGQLDFFDQTFDAEALFGQCGALVYVIDAQDDFSESMAKLQQTIRKASQVNPNIRFEVFVHKVDGLSDDHKMECQRDVQQQVMEDLQGEGIHAVPISFHLTSIYDHSIFEAFSKVVQKLIPQLPTLESLLDSLCATTRIEKAFLFDVVSKIYIATDSSPVDPVNYELCSDMIDVVIDTSCIYSEGGDGQDDKGEAGGSIISYDRKTNAVIRLNSGLILYLREMNEYLALVCLIRTEHFDRLGLVDYNLNVFRTAVSDVFRSPQEALKQAKSKMKRSAKAK